jgi:hypothetical protein
LKLMVDFLVFFLKLFGLVEKIDFTGKASPHLIFS